MSETKIAFGALFGSFVVKIALNVPMMYFSKIFNIEAYYATIITNILVQGLATMFILIILKKKYNFSYRSMLKPLGKTLLSLAVMLAILAGVSKLIPLNTLSRLSSILVIGMYSIIGAAVYIVCAVKLKIIDDIFGKEKISSLLLKIKNKVVVK